MTLARSHRFAALIAVLLLLQGVPVTLLVRMNHHGSKCAHCTGTFCVKGVRPGKHHHGMAAGHTMPPAPETADAGYHAGHHAGHGTATHGAVANTGTDSPVGATICPCDKSDRAPAIALLLDKVILPETSIETPPVRTRALGNAVATAVPSPFVDDIFHPPPHLL